MELFDASIITTVKLPDVVDLVFPVSIVGAKRAGYDNEILTDGEYPTIFSAMIVTDWGLCIADDTEYEARFPALKDEYVPPLSYE